jgi:hypothetical protein
MLTDYHILKRWKNYFSQQLNVRRISDVRQVEMHTAQPLVSEPNTSEDEISVAKLKKY